MSFTDTPDFDYYNSMVVGYSIEYNDFCRFISSYILDEEKANSPGWQRFTKIHLEGGAIDTINKIINNKSEFEIKFHYSKEKVVIGVQIIEFDEKDNSFELDIFENMKSRKSKIDSFLEELPVGIEIKKIINSSFKVHFLFYN